MVASSTMGIPPAAINGDVVPSFTTIFLFMTVQAARFGNPEMIIRLAATWHKRRKVSEISRMSIAFVMRQNGTSCSWSEWLDLRIEQLRNVHGPIVKEDV